MEQFEELQGTIERLLFQNEENGFSIFVLQIGPNTRIVVKGYIPSIYPGQRIQAVGGWVTHPKFGRQFEAQKCTTTVPTTITGLKKYLGCGLIKGIGPAYAEKLVDYFGTQVLDIIDQDPSRLQEVPGIKEKRIDRIIEAWKQQKEIANVMVFLQGKGISTTYATKIYKKYGEQSLTVLQENPYRLTEDIWGIGFKIADQIAQNLGVQADSLTRMKAGLLFIITQQIGNGHLYIEVEQLKEQIVELIGLERSALELRIKQSLSDLYHEGKIKLITHQEHHYITLASYYFSEKGVATKIRTLQKSPPRHVLPIDEIYQSLRASPEHAGITLHERQQEALMTSLQHKITIITGGPGTGKTTVIKKLLTILDAYRLSYRLAAPTGRAAKRITQSTGKHAVTIHRLLEFDVASYRFQYHEDNALPLDFLIIDEASMIDIFLAHAILKAMPLHARLIFIGDIDQLPSVGAGNFLNDLIASNLIPTVRLHHIFRQADDSLIVVNAHRVNNGEFPISFLPDVRKDFLFIKEEDPAQVMQHIQALFQEKLPNFHIHPDDAIVLTPMQKGLVGTLQLNQHLQHLLNAAPHANHIVHNGITFKEGDRVMQLKNNYEKHVFNGDIGFIKEINKEEKTVSVLFDELVIAYDFTELDELVLSYAITIHKSQGSEYKAVIIPLFMQHFTLLQRNLIYTAITRAKKLCIIIGQPKALAMGIKNKNSVQRITFLQEFLTSDLQCR
jgi:exodeoxyribonuclease V alpha subunit